MCGHVLSHVRLFCHCVDYQAPLSIEFSRQEYWGGLPKNKNWDSYFLSKGIDPPGSLSSVAQRDLETRLVCHHHGKYHLVKLCAGGISLTVQWLGFLGSTIEGTGLIPGGGNKTPHALQPKQINKLCDGEFVLGCTTTDLSFKVPWQCPLWLGSMRKMKRRGPNHLRPPSTTRCYLAPSGLIHPWQVPPLD